MRLLGIDFGTKRVGIALSDEGGVMSFPHCVLPNDAKLLNVVAELVSREKVGTVVIGTSIDLKSAPNAIQEHIDAFVKELRALVSVPIHDEVERYTTQEALRIQGRTAMTDASAAALILDSYITRIARN